MRTRVLFTVILVCLPIRHLWADPAPQTRPWRIAVGGAYCTGYLGLFALHGLPRERITEDDLSNLSRLRQYNMIFVGMRGLSGNTILPAVEQYVRDGGVAVIETGLQPSVTMLPGRRVGPAPHPNIRFLRSGTPLTEGLPELGVIPCMSGNGIAIVPDAGAKVTVLAEFTEEDAPPKMRGTFVVGGKALPAIVMAEIGEGKLIYATPSIAFNLSLRGRQFEPFICNLVKHLSEGELDDRMYPGTVERSQLATEPPEAQPEPPYPAPAGEPAAPPQGLEVFAAPDELTDFGLHGKLAGGAAARVLISYWSPQLHRELVFDKGKVTLQRQAEGRTVKVATGTLPAGEASILIMRRAGLVTVEANREIVLAAADGPPQQGALAATGLQEPAYQPLDQVRFDDDFMRESTTDDEWEQVRGKWQIMAAEGKPEMGANPFDYVATATDSALTLNGSWFWRDYAYDVSLKPDSGKAAGLVAHWRDATNFVALRLNFESQPGRLQLVRVKPSGQQVLAETAIDGKTSDWFRLGLRTSNGVLQGLLDGRVRVQARADDALCGQIGLFCEKGQSSFDDIMVRPWVAASVPPREVGQLMVMQGDWRANEEGLLGSGSRGARAFPAWGSSGGDCSAQVEVRLGQAAAAGLHFRYTDPNQYYLMALMNDKGKMRLRLYRHGNPGAILVEKPVPGDTRRWHRLQAEVRGGRLYAAVDGQPIIDILDPGHREGMVGLYARGEKAASFRGFTAQQVEPDEHLVDEVTPAFAGIIDRHTWAGRSGAWTPDPANLDCFWHYGYLPADFKFATGVHPGSTGGTRTAIYLGRDQRKDSGYALAMDRNWAAKTVALKLLRLGTVVAKAEAPVTPGQPYAVSLARRGQQLMIEVDHKPTLAYRDNQPPPNLDNLGLEQTGGLIYADDLAVSSHLVDDYTFESAPTDWAVQQGLWEITSRWSCTPGWAWFSGQAETGYALISTKASYQGDQELVMYVAPKMMPIPDQPKRFRETFGDVYLSLCSDGKTGLTGYQVAFAGQNSAYTVLRKEGKIVAQCPYRLPQSGEHNDWLRLVLRKRGPKVAAWVWDVPVLEWDDSEPLNAGRMLLGTRDNGIMIPRVTIFARRLES